MYLCYKCSILTHHLYAESIYHVTIQFTFLHHYTIRQHCAEFELCDIKKLLVCYNDNNVVQNKLN